jgi:hypothetical protein
MAARRGALAGPVAVIAGDLTRCLRSRGFTGLPAFAFAITSEAGPWPGQGSKFPFWERGLVDDEIVAPGADICGGLATSEDPDAIGRLAILIESNDPVLPLQSGCTGLAALVARGDRYGFLH